ncbi:4580_t:CDS:2 [Rhizophagus irregularis]|nr:4580_t:CDS:2 [Rhizophagus irregularis]
MKKQNTYSYQICLVVQVKVKNEQKTENIRENLIWVDISNKTSWKKLVIFLVLIMKADQLKIDGEFKKVTPYKEPKQKELNEVNGNGFRRMMKKVNPQF